MRVFIAVKISKENQRLLERLIEDAKMCLELKKGTKWVKSENFHLTLKFMGEIEEEKIEILKRALLQSVQGQESFHLELKSFGVFPNINRARVFWVGVEGNVNQLMKLAESVEKETVQAGFPAGDKPFSAHLTIARFSFPPKPTFQESLKKYQKFSFGKCSVDRIHLVQSVLNPSGAEYTTLEEFTFHAD